jgi:predicted PurR-regulated permease PerM
MTSTRTLIRCFLLGLILPLVFLNGWLLLQLFAYFQSLLSIFITATLISFLLGHPVRGLTGLMNRSPLTQSPLGPFSRLGSVMVIGLLCLGLLVVAGVTLVPLLVGQIQALGEGLPDWLESSNQQIQSISSWASDRRLPINLRQIAEQSIAQLSVLIQNLTSQMLTLLLQTAGRVSEVVLTLAIVFYMLLRGDEFWDGLFSWFPPSFGREVRACFQQNFRNYYAGQATLALLMGGAMICTFLALQVPFGLIFGLAVGVMTLFPFGAAFSIAAIALLLAFKSLWLGLRVFTVALLVNQAIENAIAPRLLGKFTGLNPIWILLSLLLGAKVGGLLGILVAVPLAGAVKSLCDRYRTPPLAIAIAPPSTPAAHRKP